MSTKYQDNVSHSRSQIDALLIRSYRYLLKLYPLSFRSDFADEMTNVFTMTLHEASGQSGLALILWREIRGLPLSLINVRRQFYNRLPPHVQRRVQIKWFVRIIGCLLSLFLLSTLTIILSPSYHLYAQAVPFVGALFAATLSMLSGLCWGRVGGLLTIASGAAIGCCMTLYLYIMAVTQIGIVLTVLIGLIWALPFLIFGILFYELSKPPKQNMIPA